MIQQSPWFPGAAQLLGEACVGEVDRLKAFVTEKRGQLFTWDFGPRAKGAFITQIKQDVNSQYLIVHSVGGVGFFQHVMPALIDLCRKRGFDKIVALTFKPGIQRLGARFGFEKKDVFFDEELPGQAGSVLLKAL